MSDKAPSIDAKGGGDASSPSSEGHSVVKPGALAKEHGDVAPSLPLKRSWFRTTFTQITILGICSFLCPGLWGATASLGAGGQQTPGLVNAANGALFSCMVVTGLLTPTITHWTKSIRLTLMIGTLGYAPYAAALYTNSAYGTRWFIVFGAVLCGLSAGIFWAAEGAVAMSYPEKDKLGKYLSYWLMFRVLGQLIGGAINLGLNVDNDAAGSISTNTYLVFVVLQALGPFFAMLLSLPHQVQRRDGTKVVLRVNDSTVGELKRMGRILVKPTTLCLLPLFFQTTFSESLIGTYNTINFTVRSRALGSFLSAVVASMSCYILGFWLDWRRFTVNFRYKVAYFVVFGLAGAWWVFAIILTNRYHDSKPTLDFGQTEWSRGFACYILLQISFNVQYELVYALTTASNDEPDEIVRLASIIRATESAGQAISYGINSTSFRLDAVAGINAGLYAISLLPAWIVTRKVGILPDGTKVHELGVGAEDGKSREEVNE